MKTSVKKMVSMAIAAAAMIMMTAFSNSARAQSSLDIEEYAEGLSGFYTGPVESDGYILTLYNETVDFETIDQEELGTAILGGLVLSYSAAGKKNDIGVIIMGTSNQAVAMSMKKKTLKKYIQGRITVDEMLAETTTATMELADVPSFNASLMESY